MGQLIIGAVGRDRPGLVGELTGKLFEAGANLADTRMVNLRGEFALLLLVEGTQDTLDRLRVELPATASAMGLTLLVADHGDEVSPLKGMPFRLKTYSMDQPGIVHRVSELLAGHGVNIEELSTRQESGPFMGAPLFTMEVRLTVPLGVKVKTLRADLIALCDSLNCDADLEPA
jgi:glycine cleavage system transcriptional repressor